MRVILAIAILALSSSIASAQGAFGNSILSNTQINHMFAQGIFYNPQALPNWGFAFDVQKETIFGAVYGYRSNGAPTFLALIGTRSAGRTHAYSGDVFESRDRGRNIVRVGSFSYTTFGVTGQTGVMLDINSNILDVQDLALKRFDFAEADLFDQFAGASWFVVRQPLSTTFSDAYEFSTTRVTSSDGAPGLGFEDVGSGRIGAVIYSEDNFIFAMIVGFNSTDDIFYGFFANNSTMWGRYWILGPGESPTGSGSHFRAIANTSHPAAAKSLIGSQSVTEEIRRFEITDLRDAEVRQDSAPAFEEALIAELHRKAVLLRDAIED